jgi:Transposase
VRAHQGVARRCSRCRRAAPGYDQLEEREWQHVPLWGIEVWFRYAPRRVECAEHGVVVEHLPWNEGKRTLTTAMMGFLARWGRRLSWREVAEVFQVSWEAVYRSVEWFVTWGLAHWELKSVESIGIDEIHWGHGLRASNFLTVVYQIDAHCRRLLWVGKGRSKRTLQQGLKALGPAVVQRLQFVCSDMWKPYLEVIAAQARQAMQVLDCFHITMHLNPGGGPGAPGGERATASGEPSGGAEAQADALGPVAARQPCAGAVPAEAPGAAGQQTANGPGLGAERNLCSFLEVPLGGPEPFSTTGLAEPCAAAWNR